MQLPTHRRRALGIIRPPPKKKYTTYSEIKRINLFFDLGIKQVNMLEN
jgi:hypothetical protein